MSALDGLRVVELVDESAEYCGRLLTGLGADVIKVEPPDGVASRQVGPYVDDEPGDEHSLHFWHYNVGKRSVRAVESCRTCSRTAKVACGSTTAFPRVD